MSDFKRVMDALREQNGQETDSAPMASVVNGCKANGCPNAGAIDRGFCYFHWVAKEAPETWASITHKIRSTWPKMRNFNVPGVDK